MKKGFLGSSRRLPIPAEDASQALTEAKEEIDGWISGPQLFFRHESTQVDNGTHAQYDRINVEEV